MTNGILQRWEEVGRASCGAAIFSPSGEVLRTWSAIESEAREFASRMSGGPGPVAVQIGNHASFPALILACLRTRRAIILQDSSAPGGNGSPVEQALGVTLRAALSEGEVAFEKCGGGSAGATASRSGICLYKLTSGTTAIPQPIGFTAGQLLADCDQVCDTMGIRAGDLSYGIISFAHSYGFSNLVTPLLCRGIPLVAASDPLPRAIESGLRSTRATVLPAVPAMFRGLLTASSLPESLRLCISAGAPLAPVLGKDFHAKFGLKIHGFYGASECGGICYDGTPDVTDKPGLVGRPLLGVEVEIPDGAEGAKILVRSKAVGVGVGNAPGRFQPADLLVRDALGFRIVGRESDWINVAGRKVNPLEIEEVIAQFPGVEEVVACAGEDAARGEEICVLVAAQDSLDPAAIRRHCADRLDSWKVPRRFGFLKEIPRNSRGKISRSEIAGMFRPGQAGFF